MGGHAEIHFVSMFGVSLFYNCMIDKSFRHVVGDQFCPYFLLDVFGLTGMKVAQPDCIFQLAERTLNSPSGSIELFDAFRREFLCRQVGNDAFIRILGYRKSYNAERQVVGIKGTIGQIVKRSIGIHIAPVRSFPDGNFSFVAAHKGNAYREIKRVLVRENKVFYNTFGMDIFCTEKKVLSFFEDTEIAR